MRTRSIFPVVLLGSLLGASCTPSPVTVDMNFPTIASFMHSDQGRLRVFRLEAPVARDPDAGVDSENELGSCPELLDGLPTMSFPSDLELVFDSGLTNACDFYNGLGVPEFGEGPHAYVLEMRASTGIILQGCSVGEVFVDAPNVRIELYPTDEYDSVIDMPVSGSPASRCSGEM